MKKSILLTFAGIILIITGYILESRSLDFGDFTQGFGAGIFIVGIFRCIFYLVKGKQVQ